MGCGAANEGKATLTKERQLLRSLADDFVAFDEGGQGALDREEFVKLMRSISSKLELLGISEEDFAEGVDGLFNFMDSDNCGWVSPANFFCAIERITYVPRGEQNEQKLLTSMREDFRACDECGKGALDREQFAKLIRGISHKLELLGISKADFVNGAEPLFNIMDLGGNGTVSSGDFDLWLTKIKGQEIAVIPGNMKPGVVVLLKGDADVRKALQDSGSFTYDADCSRFVAKICEICHVYGNGAFNMQGCLEGRQ